MADKTGVGEPKKTLVGGSLASWRRKAREYRTAGLLTILITLQLAAAVISPLREPSDDWLWEGLSLGVVGATLAPPTLLALWAVFGPQPAVARLPLTTWLIAAFALCLAAGAILAIGEPAPGNSVTISLGAMWLLAFFVMQVPLWLLRAVRRWRLEHIGSASNQPAKPAHQFTLRGLLGLTLGAALLLGAWQWMHSPGKVRLASIRWSSLDDFESSLRIALVGLPIVPLAWILLASGKRPVLRTLLSVLIVAGIAGALRSLRYFDGYSDAAQQVACVEAGTLLSGFVNLAVVRACGYRLNRRPMFRHAERRTQHLCRASTQGDGGAA